MGPIDIKYHVVSIVAVFLALGVGIVVGSNSNLIGTNSMIDSQNAIISRLEENYGEMRKEMLETKAAMSETGDYLATLETKTIPVLLDGKLSGFTFGVVVLGAVSQEADPAAPLVDALKKAGAENEFVLTLDKELLKEAFKSDPEGFPRKLAGELLGGDGSADDIAKLAAGTPETGPPKSGGEKKLDGVVFLLGDELEDSFLSEVVVPVQLRMGELDGIVSALAVGEKPPNAKIFSRNALTLIPGADALPGRMEAAADLAKKFTAKKEPRLSNVR